jgi:uncharacterized membrane protein
MTPIMRVVLPIIGALIGWNLGDPASQVFDLLIGAAIGFTIADLGILRARLDELGLQVARLGTEFRPRHEAPPASTIHHPEPVRQPENLKVTPDAVTQTPSRPLTPTGPPRHEFDELPDSADQPKPSERPPGPTAVKQTELRIVSAIRDFLTGGNTLVRAGVIVLFFGVAFLLRYMAEHTHVPIELRLTGISLGGVALLMFGWRLRTTRVGYALAVQGGGVGILYLTVFAALHLYTVLPASIAFPLLAAIATLTAILAVLQNSIAFAVLAVSGGFLAPVLASTGQGSHVVLFSYYAVLNFGILTVAWYKAWRPLNIAGFIFTFAIGTAWGVLKYRAEDFATTEPFLVLFFVFYLAISILFTVRQPVKLTGYIDGTLVFGTPIIVFALQSAMLHDRLMALAYSAIIMSALYLGIAWLLKRFHDDAQQLLREAFLALGVAFLTLAVPLALDARWNAAAWALEGAALVWVGCRQNRPLSRLFGALLNIAAGCVLGTEIDITTGHITLPSGGYVGVLLQSAAAIFSACSLQSARQRLRSFEQLIPDALYWWGAGWWLIGGLSQIFQYLPAYAMPAALILVTGTTMASSEIHRRTLLGSAKVGALLQLPAMLAFALNAALTLRHPAAGGGWLAWPLVFVGLWGIVFRHEGAPRAPLAVTLHAISTWLFYALLSWELAWQVHAAVGIGAMWPAAVWAVFPALFVFLLPRLVTRVAWPFARNRTAYLFVVGVGIVFYLCAWSLVTNATSLGDAAPLPYVPLLNPLDLTQLFILLILFRYWRFLKPVRSTEAPRIDPRVPMPALWVLAFIWLNAVLLRTLHQWFAVPFGLEHMMASTLVQTSLSIFWAILALVTMLMATHKRYRLLWLVGAVLLAVVIAKLFLIDLSRTGSVERIVSFVGVGLLMLVVGYFSPLPPAGEARQ